MQSKYSKEFLLDIYENMIRIRQFEEKSGEAFSQGLLAGNIHLSIGQEATEVGAIKALEERDFITSTHRGHGHAIAKGAKTDKMMAELYGKKTGYCKGKGGSMHIADVSLGILGANGIVGAGIPIAAGSALTSKIRGTDEVTMSLFGDAASNQGTFHEAINMAAAWNLPAVFLVENNGYGVSVPIESVINTDSIAERAKAYGIPGVTVDGNDPLAVYEVTKEAVDRARSGHGPSIVECMTFRNQGHYMGDPATYRPEEYMEEALKREAIPAFRKLLIELDVTEEEIVEIEAKITEEIEAANQFAIDSDYPELEEAFTDVYSSDNKRGVER